MQSDSTERVVRVICLGNELVYDDGVGIRVGRVLQRLPLPAGITVELRRALGLELLDELTPDQEIILIDASRTGSEAGTLHFMELDQAAQLAETPYCCHGVGIAEVLKLAARISPDRLPPRTQIIGIEAENLTAYGLSLTPAVREAIPAAVVASLRAMGADEPLLEQGRREAVQWMDWDPTIEDVIR